MTVRLQNMGSADLTSVIIEVSQGGRTLLTYLRTGSLSPYDIGEVNLGQVTPSGNTTYTM